MALGLQRLGLLDEALIAVNIADDHSFYGLHISPDMDTILYMLADLIDPVKGWGLRDDTTRTIDSLTELGEEVWFHVGDRDMATHLLRTSMLSSGATLVDVARQLCGVMDLPRVVTPISNSRVRTRITISADAEVDFQTYHVRLRAGPEVKSVRYEGVEAATPAPGILDALREARLVILAPSSPVSSILPMLEVPGVRSALALRKGRTVAVSPLVLGATPDEIVAARSRTCHQLLVGAGYEPTPHSVAALYADLIDEFIVDTIDAENETSLMPPNVIVRAATTITPSADTAAALIRFILD